jgi:nucleoside-diphosphate-sugar epimerase
VLKPERILVTGGAGFVGLHVTAALVAAGHHVRLLGPGPEIPGRLEYRRGEVADVAAVGRAVKDCTAVINAAPGLAGTTTVLKAAVAEGCDPIVEITTPASHAEKPAAVAVARRLQEAGSPVAIVHCGDVFGPDDPQPGELTVLIRDILHGRPWVQPAGQWLATDVRDVARVAVTALTGREPRTHPAPGRTLDGPGLWRILREVTGRRLPAITLPWRRATSAVGETDDALRRATSAVGETDDALRRATAATGEAEETSRPTAQTIRDTVTWLHLTGHLTAKQAGHAA